MCAELLLQFNTVETLQTLRPCFENMHVVGIYSSDYFLSLFCNLNLVIFRTFSHLESDVPVGGIVFHKHIF